LKSSDIYVLNQRMSLTLHPVNSSLFIKPEPMSVTTHHHRVHSLESLDTRQMEDRLAGHWLDAWTPQFASQAASNRLFRESAAAALGTTFPPRTGMGEYFKGHLRQGDIETFSSAPDLTPLAISTDDMYDLGVDHDDADHLFEFDMSPERELLPTALQEADSGSTNLPELLRTYSSDSSCTREDEVGSKAGFSSIFGSTSSGLGSERRLSQDNVLCELEEGKSFEPSEWRDYMNERLSSEGTSTPVSQEGTPEPLDSGVPTDGSATPILTAAAGAGNGSTSPLISPDSLLEGQHLDDHLFASRHSEDACRRCEPGQDAHEASDSEDAQARSGSQHTTRLKEDELAQLLDQLEDDQRGYPGVSSDDSFSSNSTIGELGDVTPVRKASVEEEFVTPKLRKCSSLKSGRTPPGTPSQRKIVRFADIFGLDLSEVKTFTDEIPRIPRRAFQDLDVDIGEYDIGSPRSQTPVFKQWTCSTPEAKVSSTSLVPMFTQPGCCQTFYDTVITKKICLENAFMEEPFTISGIVRVHNLDFNKAVTVRWTVNDWNTQNDMPASYVDGSSDGLTDKFSFRIVLGCLPVGSRVQFCLKYDVAGSQYWDNNNGGNYVFQVFLNSNSPGGSGGVNYRSSPLSITSLSRRSFPTYQSYHQSPSFHGDDPWARFM